MGGGILDFRLGEEFDNCSVSKLSRCSAQYSTIPCSITPIPFYPRSISHFLPSILKVSPASEKRPISAQSIGS